MGASRQAVRSGGLVTDRRAGDAVVSGRQPVVVTADANYTMTPSDVAAGFLQFTGFTAGRNITLPSATQLNDAFPEVGIGEAVELLVSITTAFAGTLVAGAGITIAPRTVINSNTSTTMLLIKTGATAWTSRCS